MSRVPASINTVTQGLSTDVRSLSTLKAQAGSDPHNAIKQVAKQIESLFMQELMKSMRETVSSDDWMDNDASKMGNEMLDQQYASQMSGLPGGLADIIARQLERQLGASATTTAASPASGATPTTTTTSPAAQHTAPTTVRPTVSATDFVRRHLAAALSAQADTGIPAAHLLGQAAHESGWGRHEIRNADGSSSHNLFGIKAGPGWSGAVAQVTTTEYVDGQARQVVAKFRSYASYEEAFRDHAKLLKSNPRYSQVIANGATAAGFATSLQSAGYATDPAYAQKLTKIINTTVQLQRLVS